MQELSLNKRKKEIIKGLMKNISSTNNNEEKLKLYQSFHEENLFNGRNSHGAPSRSIVFKGAHMSLYSAW